MNDEIERNPITKFLRINRARFESLQEMSFDRNEQKIREILQNNNEPLKYPIPPIVPFILIWLFIILFPLLLILDPSYSETHYVNVRGIIGFYLPLIMTLFIFRINQNKLVPRCIFHKHYASYFVYNAILIFIALFIREIAFFFLDRGTEDSWHTFFTSYCFSFVKGHFSIWTIIFFIIVVSIVCVICVIFHIIMRQLARSFIMREQRRTELQYELDFLKNQLSPHFLFNTLNNISALIQFDPKRAEESMTKLSKLLRIMLYQTGTDQISLAEDMDILQKFADLEKLRLDENYDLKFDIELENPDFKIAPLIAMPLIENSIKHSLNPKGKSFAHISIVQKEDWVKFSIENSNFPRKSSPKAGGLGLSTFKRRLDLLYLNKYSYTVNVDKDVYKSELLISMKNLDSDT